MTAFYLAARYSRREELCAYKADLEERGHSVRGGRHVEFGIALGMRLGRVVTFPELYVVGAIENVFYALDIIDGAWPDWPSALAGIDTIEHERRLRAI